ncbi:MAG: 4-hydroxyphenylacetate 3-hydroxylase N-terminal domain-containing protein [Smithellaceae bacterium]|nr:4-hydroxyphenylacetate 3-hydroxylase N-terminal domain-containing protein [Smithellaceae bacterium]
MHYEDKTRLYKWIVQTKRNIYFDGQLIDRTDELQMRCLNTIGTTYDEAARPENRELMTAIFNLTGERINRFNHIHQNSDDLHKKQDMTRMLCQKVGGCIQRCMGTDAVNAIYNVSYEADKANNGEKSHGQYKLRRGLHE